IRSRPSSAALDCDRVGTRTAGRGDRPRLHARVPRGPLRRGGRGGARVSLASDAVRAAPKVLLHDHLDGGLRPQTVLELARRHGYTRLPRDTGPELARWFRESAASGSLPEYLSTFTHT